MPSRKNRPSHADSSAQGLNLIFALGSLDADLRKIGEKVGGPTVDVVFVNGFAQVEHAGGLLLGAHIERLVNGIGKLLDVIGIDEQSVCKFVSVAGKRTEAQDDLFIVASGDDYLGHQIHTVMQRSDQANQS